MAEEIYFIDDLDVVKDLDEIHSLFLDEQIEIKPVKEPVIEYIDTSTDKLQPLEIAVLVLFTVSIPAVLMLYTLWYFKQ